MEDVKSLAIDTTVSAAGAYLAAHIGSAARALLSGHSYRFVLNNHRNVAIFGAALFLVSKLAEKVFDKITNKSFDHEQKLARTIGGIQITRILLSPLVDVSLSKAFLIFATTRFSRDVFAKYS